MHKNYLTFMVDLYKKIRAYRESLNLSQEGFGRRYGARPSTVSAWECDRCWPRWQNYIPLWEDLQSYPQENDPIEDKRKALELKR